MPDFSLEQLESGVVAGVDEAGRGPWAGPVVASAVILAPSNIPSGINDSKKLSAIKREKLYQAIIDTAQVGVGISSVEEIDSLNILGATKLAMQRAVQALRVKPEVLLVDGNQPIPSEAKVVTVVQGDAISLSIAAASIIAKVTRDRIMQELHEEFPHYGWNKNAGYGTVLHIKGLERCGVTSHHRKSFAPIRKLIEEKRVA